MIELNKTYKTTAGRKVKLSFIDHSTVYGHVETLDTGPESAANHPWAPMIWNKHTGLSSAGSDMTLVEVKPSKRVSVRIIIDEKGVAHLSNSDMQHLSFASFTVNVEVFEGEHNRIINIGDPLTAKAK